MQHTFERTRYYIRHLKEICTNLIIKSGNSLKQNTLFINLFLKYNRICRIKYVCIVNENSLYLYDLAFSYKKKNC